MGKKGACEKPIFPFLPVGQTSQQNSMREGRTKRRVDFVHRIQILILYKITPTYTPGLLIPRKITPPKDKQYLKIPYLHTTAGSTSLNPLLICAFFPLIRAISFYFYYF